MGDFKIWCTRAGSKRNLIIGPLWYSYIVTNIFTFKIWHTWRRMLNTPKKSTFLILATCLLIHHACSFIMLISHSSSAPSPTSFLFPSTTSTTEFLFLCWQWSIISLVIHVCETWCFYDSSFNPMFAFLLCLHAFVNFIPWYSVIDTPLCFCLKSDTPWGSGLILLFILTHLDTMSAALLIEDT